MVRNLQVWVGVCVVLGLAMAASGTHPGALMPATDPAAWRLMAAAGAALAVFAVVLGAAAFAARRSATEANPAAATIAGEPDAGAAADLVSRVAQRPYTTLFLASFVALFVEVMLIRYASSQIRIFAFYKNVPLVAAFLGLGLGCCLGRGRGRHALLFLLWLLPLAAALAHGTVAVDFALARWAEVGSSEHIQGVGAAGALGGQPAHDWAAQLAMGLFCVGLLAAVSGLFALLGRLLGDAFERVPRLPGYTANLLGSLTGILVFVGLCYLETPPCVWFAVGLLPLLWWTGGGARAGVVLVLVAAATLMVWPSVGDTHWSRYQKLVGRAVALPGTAGTAQASPAYLVNISDVFYQVAVDLRPAAIARLGGNPYPHYDLAFRLAPRKDRVLIVGAGTGNDVAAALRAGARSVDAVDIDDEIVQLGRLHHPEHPYDDPRVHVIIDDARRAFRRLPAGSYDAIVFGLLDSHTQLGISSVRLDNYVFTLESLAAARRLLRPGGSLVITAATFRDWFRSRFAAMLRATCGAPITLYNLGEYSTYACQVADPGRAPSGGRIAESVTLPTDDWPFLYLPDKLIPRAYLVALAMLALASVAVLKVGGLELGRFGAWHGHLFFLGAGFLLMEVYAINRLALLFGTTWLVSAVTIAVVLVLIVAANLTVESGRALPVPWAYGALAASLLAGYIVGPAAVLGRGTGAALLYAVLLLAPVYFAGLIFSRSFSRATASGAAIGVNILGSVVGGWAEYSTMVVGIRGLALLALAFYLLSWLMLQRGQRDPTGAGIAKLRSAGIAME